MSKFNQVVTVINKSVMEMSLVKDCIVVNPHRMDFGFLEVRRFEDNTAICLPERGDGKPQYINANSLVLINHPEQSGMSPEFLDLITFNNISFTSFCGAFKSLYLDIIEELEPEMFAKLMGTTIHREVVSTMTNIKACATCGVEFEAKSKNAKYCPQHRTEKERKAYAVWAAEREAAKEKLWKDTRKENADKAAAQEAERKAAEAAKIKADAEAAAKVRNKKHDLVRTLLGTDLSRLEAIMRVINGEEVVAPKPVVVPEVAPKVENVSVPSGVVASTVSLAELAGNKPAPAPSVEYIKVNVPQVLYYMGNANVKVTVTQVLENGTKIKFVDGRDDKVKEFSAEKKYWTYAPVSRNVQAPVNPSSAVQANAAALEILGYEEPSEKMKTLGITLQIVSIKKGATTTKVNVNKSKKPEEYGPYYVWTPATISLSNEEKANIISATVAHMGITA